MQSSISIIILILSSQSVQSVEIQDVQDVPDVLSVHGYSSPEPDSYMQNGYSKSVNGSKIEVPLTKTEIVKLLNLTFIPSDTNVLMREGDIYAFSSPDFPYAPRIGSKANWTLVVPGNHIIDLKLYGYQIPCSWGHHLEMFFGSWGEVCTDPETQYFTNGRISYTNTDRRPKTFLLNFRIDRDARKANTHGFYLSAITYPSESRPIRPSPECGTRVSPIPEKEDEEDAKPYIVGGKQAERNQWPWQALIVIREGRSSFTCGASLISERWVMSAAHCTYGSWAVFAFLGCDDRHYGECDQVHAVLGPRNIINHEAYDPDELFDGNDISLLRLPVRANLNNRVRLICMPSLPAPTTGEKMLVSGFGYTKEGGTISPVLKEGAMSTVDDSYCQWKWEYPISKDTLCTVPGENNTQVFFGDSGGYGGAFVDGQAVQWGVVSFGPQHLNEGIPVIFTEVYDFREWIYETTSSKISRPRRF